MDSWKEKSVFLYIQGPLGPRFGKEGKRLCFTTEMKMELRVAQQTDDQAPGQSPAHHPSEDSGRGCLRDPRARAQYRSPRQVHGAGFSQSPAPLNCTPHHPPPLHINPSCSRIQALQTGLDGGQECQEDQKLTSIHYISTFQ